jgi:hypothetical protein
MSLGDVVSASGLALFAQVALLLFAAIFLYVVAATLARRNQSTFERARFLPLDGDPPAPPEDPAAGRERPAPETTR